VAARARAEALAQLAAYVGAPADSLVFVPNATSGVNLVAHSLPLGPGDEVLATDHEYGAMELVWRDACERAGARYVVQPVPVPCLHAEEVVDAVWAGVTERTRVLFASHVTSPTAIRLPIDVLCRRARAAGIVSVVDGAHVPGQLDVDLASVDADFYAGNCHKWLCAPKGAGFLFVRADHRDSLRPLVVSWGWRAEAPFSERHGWQGTRDPSAALTVPAAIEFQREHDWPAVRRVCHELLAEFRPRLGVPLTPDGPEWFAQMAAVELGPCNPEQVQRRLRDEYGIEVLVQAWQGRPLLRVSVQGYNTRDDLERLMAGLPQVL
jgi:isopenicillin-N epimerase